MSGNSKRYYWLKLKKGFFDSVKMKALRKKPNGAELTIVYLKMLLLSISEGGYIVYEGVAETLEEEISMVIDESPEAVTETINFLINVSLADTVPPNNLVLPEAIENTGSEGASAERMRNKRKRDKKTEMSQCDSTVTQSKRKRKEIEKEIDTEKETGQAPDASLADPEEDIFSKIEKGDFSNVFGDA